MTFIKICKDCYCNSSFSWHLSPFLNKNCPYSFRSVNCKIFYLPC